MGHYSFFTQFLIPLVFLLHYYGFYSPSLQLDCAFDFWILIHKVKGLLFSRFSTIYFSSPLHFFFFLVLLILWLSFTKIHDSPASCFFSLFIYEALFSHFMLSLWYVVVSKFKLVYAIWFSISCSHLLMIFLKPVRNYSVPTIKFEEGDSCHFSKCFCIEYSESWVSCKEVCQLHIADLNLHTLRYNYTSILVGYSLQTFTSND